MSSYGVYDSLCPSLRLSPFENKVGGYPDFYKECLLTSAPSCDNCHAPLVLLVQIYCPLEGSCYHRLLHVFCCTGSACSVDSRCWLVLRSQSLDPPTSQGDREEGSLATNTCHGSATDWCEQADNWGSDEDEIYIEEEPHPTDGVSSALDDLTISSLSEPTSSPDADKPLPPYHGPCYASGYVSTAEECTGCTQTTQATRLLEQYQSENPNFPMTGSSSNRREGKSKDLARGKGGGSEQYEKTQARHGDEGFLKFQKELLKCPQQIIRYCWKGEPALMKRGFVLPEETKLCNACGAPRVFEFQLMPTLIYIVQTKLLPQAPPPAPALPEFGTVLIYSCSASCWQEKHTDDIMDSGICNFRKELAIVQSESTE